MTQVDQEGRWSARSQVRPSIGTPQALLAVPSAATMTSLLVADREVDVNNPPDENAKTRAVLLTPGPKPGYLQGTLGADLPLSDPKRPWSPLPSPVGKLSLHLDTTAVEDVFVLLTWARK
jgi:hypothetical protein